MPTLAGERSHRGQLRELCSLETASMTAVEKSPFAGPSRTQRNCSKIKFPPKLHGPTCRNGPTLSFSPEHQEASRLAIPKPFDPSMPLFKRESEGTLMCLGAAASKPAENLAMPAPGTRAFRRQTRHAHSARQDLTHPRSLPCPLPPKKFLDWGLFFAHRRPRGVAGWRLLLFRAPPRVFFAALCLVMAVAETPKVAPIEPPLPALCDGNDVVNIGRWLNVARAPQALPGLLCAVLTQPADTHKISLPRPLPRSRVIKLVYPLVSHVGVVQMCTLSPRRGFCLTPVADRRIVCRWLSATATHTQKHSITPEDAKRDLNTRLLGMLRSQWTQQQRRRWP